MGGMTGEMTCGFVGAGCGDTRAGGGGGGGGFVVGDGCGERDG